MDFLLKSSYLSKPIWHCLEASVDLRLRFETLKCKNFGVKPFSKQYLKKFKSNSTYLQGTSVLSNLRTTFNTLSP